MHIQSIWSILISIKSFQVQVSPETEDWLDCIIERKPTSSDVWGDFIEQTTKLVYTTEMDQGHDLTIGKFPGMYRRYYRKDFDFRNLHHSGDSEKILMEIDKIECSRFKKERLITNYYIRASVVKLNVLNFRLICSRILSSSTRATYPEVLH